MNENNNNLQETEGVIDIKEIVFIVLNKWYWFVASVIICIIFAAFYIKKSTPTYDVTASILIKHEQGSGGSGAMGGMLDMENFGIFSNTNNFDNEIEIIQSRTIITKTVSELGLYINHYKEGLLRDYELYKNSPIKVWIGPTEASKLSSGIKMTLKKNSEGNIELLSEYRDILTEEDVEEDTLITSFPTVLNILNSTFTLTLEDSEAFDELEAGDKIFAYINTPAKVANGYIANLNITPSSKFSTIASTSFKTTNTQRGIDFINKLVELYNKDANDDKNEVASKSAEFINERIRIINLELGTTEAELEVFKRTAGITDLESEAKLALEENTEYKRKTVENSTQTRLIKDLKEYATNPANMYEVLPLNVGIRDNGLTEVITGYNEVLLERKRLLRTSSENNPAIINLNITLESLRKNILTTINSVERGLQITEDDLKREAMSFENRIAQAPTTERKFISISRQQELKSQLYLILLQKREENAITLASTANNAKIFDEAYANNIPIAPRKLIILLLAIVAGCVIPAGILFLKEFFRNKISTIEDIEKITEVPIVGSIPRIKEMPNSNNSIVVTENSNDIMVEGFRQLRTNITYMMKPTDKVILVTSTHTKEGKSYTSVNLAISMALLGKKVVLVGLDIRKPGLNSIIGLKTKPTGITSFLSEQTSNLFSLVNKSNIHENLDIIFGGIIPPNPTELLNRSTMEEAINTLKEKYDYIILDTAPVGMVSDTLQFSKFADISLYICRANITKKNDYSLINYMHNENKLINMCTAIIGVDIEKKSYGYGYAGRYGYAHSYSYGVERKSKK